MEWYFLMPCCSKGVTHTKKKMALAGFIGSREHSCFLALCTEMRIQYKVQVVLCIALSAMVLMLTAQLLYSKDKLNRTKHLGTNNKFIRT